MTVVMSYAADRTEAAEQAAPGQSATQNADAVESVAEVITPHPTEVPAAAVELARSAAVAEAGDAGQIGEHLDAIGEDEVARTIRFAALDPGYRGWQWSVTVALVPGETATVSEVVLLPGPDALVAPPWLPWDQRLRPGDLGPADLLPAAADDVRLVPGYVENDDPAIEDLATEVGLGRERVLSREGRDDAAERWHDGPFGPLSPTAKAAPASCGTCGFFAPLAGSLGGAFGVCANEFSPADARVVDVAFGCGAHSEVPAPPPAVVMGGTALDEVTLEVHPRPVVEPGSDRDGVDAAEGAGGSTADTDEAPAAGTDDAPAAGTDEPRAEDLTDADAVTGLAGPAGEVPVTDPLVAVEPETVTQAAEVAGPEAEILLTATDVEPAPAPADDPEVTPVDGPVVAPVDEPVVAPVDGVEVTAADGPVVAPADGPEVAPVDGADGQVTPERLTLPQADVDDPADG